MHLKEIKQFDPQRMANNQVCFVHVNYGPFNLHLPNNFWTISRWIAQHLIDVQIARGVCKYRGSSKRRTH